MNKLIVNIPAQRYEIDLDDWKSSYSIDGEWDMDGIFDGFVHEIVTQPEYSWEIV